MEFYFSGTIERIIFENPSSFFRILLLDIDDTDADFDNFEIIVTGTMADIMEGEDYTFWGNLVQHPKYGEQLKITRYERAKPTSKGLVKYFSSDHFKGIGVKTAQKIVDLYGDNTIDKVLAEPEKLKDIAGLSAKNREAFIMKLRQNYGTERVLAKLSEYGISNKLAFQIHDFYKEETLEIVEHYPYQLVEDIQGIGFKIADQLAQSLGIESTAPERFRAGLLHTLLTQSMEKGDTYLEAKELLEHTIELLESSRQIELDPSSVADELAHLIEEDKVQNVDTKIFENSLFFAEEGICNNLLRILEKENQNKYEPEKIEAALTHIEEEFAISYDAIQKQAICNAIQHKIFILTGGPGTGKTTVINGIIAVYALLHGLDLHKSQDLPILLAAPTGRAARRMNELTGLPSATIHRHLGMTGDDDTSHLDDYLDTDFIIVDEFSMVDTWLANQLLSNISSNSKLLIVGDADQLPSVSPGQVLADLLKIPLLPQTKLEKIYRQSKDSTIVTLASQIQKGILPPDFIEKKADRSYFEARSEHIPQMIERIVEAAIRSGIPAQDVQVLAPMYRGQAGIDHINQLMQNLINPAETEQIIFEATDCQYRQGDKVIHLVNDAESNVFNGDLGYITDLLPAKYTDSKQDELTINFDGNEIVYQRSEWYKIRLAYAMSIHKSQGSEFPVVILPITSSSHRMLQRNLIYTAITRAKSKLILLGEKSAFAFAVQNTGTTRKTYLKERFEDFLNVEKVIHTSVDNLETTVGNYVLTEENFLKINPMIGITDEDIQNIFGE
ncbi:SF1B family DNA helicase RecD2 [Streptococcus constellatus subsp. pharyngis]|uniref:ATP-dependent RecD2 DNA helicase n=2 Tax=Streptococcus constellatus subsp. pharyngis SK1060 = CCUG 46377 TaxID=1035184 RepID=U2ZMF3_STRCV|nr:ATP-dependent RecD-like DNA helicase [Streptococcus constellatus]AGU72112.1 exodeoxyribonuclease V alpha chain [Streptococcus constellatus subsp. pharyngis C232]AGU73868.1 exodeoxyribonuclease V alpha chain [Streptococcus constellatus subsp. pharyngis C818]AGU79236.1 exodeoxyribonuclease V alpha chain [Streptococcus constellatus subsp. pharyngis C1050]QRP81490.1 ATP-dependent RecD-like DNA helicase [Streptococcus constellatus]GAD43698.1 ATP-dependent exoDNAse, alpha subunit - helicase super